MADSTPAPDEAASASAGTGHNKDDATTPAEGPTRNIRKDGEGPTTIQDVQPDVDELPSLLPLDPPQRPGSLGRLNHYEVLNLLGEGGMGVVVRAFDEALHRNVAVKFMSKQMIASDSARKRFIREARSAAGINHPNVVTIHAVAEEDGVPFLVMEYVDGGTLRQRIDADAPMDVADILRICAQICDGLEAAHRQGVIHRDIKPSNVMLEDGIERVKITDFGLARLIEEHSDLTSLGDMVGTPSFMSPEQVGGEELDCRSDLFSLGCVMYAMIAGRSPFRGGNVIATARRVRDEAHEPLNQAHPDTPEFLVDIVDRLLQKRPDDRFATAAELGELLREKLAKLDQTKNAETVVVDATATSPSRRSPGLLVALAGCLALVAIVWMAGPFSNRSNTTDPADVPPAESSGTDVRPAQTLSVAQDGEADFDSLQAAIDAARPGDVIEILDDSTYEGPFVIADERLRDVSIIARDRATLTAAEQGAVLTIAVRGVRVQGCRFRPGPETHSLYLHWDVTGCTLEDLELIQPSDAQWANVLLAQECVATREYPLVITSCRFTSAKYGIYIGQNSDPDALEAAHIVVDRNLFSGPAIHLSLNHSVQDLRFRFNRVSGGTGLHFNLQGAQESGAFQVANNTFSDVDTWILFSEDRADYPGLACNNLILESIAPFPSAELQRRSWAVHHNLWEALEAPGNLPPEMVTFVPDAGIPHRDLHEAEFLTPASDGLSATAGSGPPHAVHVGAMPPSSE